MTDERAKIFEAVLKLKQAKKCIREHIDGLDKSSASDMFEAGALREDFVLIACIVENLLKWRDQRCRRRQASTRPRRSRGPTTT